MNRVVKRMKEIFLDSDPRIVDRKIYGNQLYIYKIEKHETTIY